MNRWLLYALGALVLIGILLVLLPPEPKTRKDQDGRPAGGMVDAPVPPPSPPSPSRPVSPAPAAVPRGPKPAPPQAPEVPVVPKPSPTSLDVSPPIRGGKIDMLKPAYEKDAPDSEAGNMEARIRKLFDRDEIPKGILQSVDCKRRVCRVRMTWSTAEPLSFMAAYMTLGMSVSKQAGVEPLADGPDEEGVLPLDIYVLRDDLSEEDLQDLGVDPDEYP